MSTNQTLNRKLAMLLFMFGFISSAQETTSMSTIIGEEQLSLRDFRTSNEQKSAISLEYSGYVVSRKTGEPVAGARLEIKNYNSGRVETIITDQKGFYTIKLPYNEKSKIVFFGQGYSKESRIIRSSDNCETVSTNNRIYLTPFESLIEKEGSVAKIKVNANDFESSGPETSDWDQTALDKVLFTMLKFPEIRIKIQSHSNEGNTDISNSVLSYFRTKAARRYLIMNGIDANRIESSNGPDSNLPEIDCPSDSNCNDQESIRRSGSDFIIVSK